MARRSVAAHIPPTRRPGRRPPAPRTSSARRRPDGTAPGTATGRGARRDPGAGAAPGPAPRRRRRWSRGPSSAADTGRPAGRPSGPSGPSPRGTATARVRRSSSGAPSRKVKGRPVRMPCASGDGSADSTKCTSIRPLSRSSSRATSPVASRGSVRQSATVWRTSTWSGTGTGPGRRRSPGRRPGPARWRPAGPRPPSAAGGWVDAARPVERGTTRARLRFHRQRAASMGWGSTAWVSTSVAVRSGSIFGTWGSGKLCWGPRDNTTVSSSAAAWSSKSNETQNRLRRARPRARLIRPPKGACTMSWVPSLSSKTRSMTIRSRVGRYPEGGQPGAQVGHHLLGHLLGHARPLDAPPAGPRRRPPAASSGSSPARSQPTSWDSSAVRAGASPSQNGMVGGGRRRRAPGPCPSPP